MENYCFLGFLSRVFWGKISHEEHEGREDHEEEEGGRMHILKNFKAFPYFILKLQLKNLLKNA